MFGLGHQLTASPTRCRTPMPSDTGKARMAVHAYAFDAFPARWPSSIASSVARTPSIRGAGAT